MTSPVLIAFKADHLLAMVNRDTAGLEDWRFALARESGGPAYTAVVGDTLLGCGGVLLPWPGMGLAWLALTAEAGRYRVWLTRTARRVLADIMRAYELHRLEAVVRADNTRNRRWIEALGFARENGCARAYTTDRVDGIRYERVRG